MTLDEAVTTAIAQIQATTKAMQLAGQNGGKPIVNAAGQPLNFKPPPLGDVLLVILNNQALMLQIARQTAVSLAGGFALSDQEANRIADLVIARAQEHDTGRAPRSREPSAHGGSQSPDVAGASSHSGPSPASPQGCNQDGSPVTTPEPGNP